MALSMRNEHYDALCSDRACATCHPENQSASPGGSRPKPPPVPLTVPPCPICEAELDMEDGTSWDCNDCWASWPFQLDEETEGTWADPESEQCPARTYQMERVMSPDEDGFPRVSKERQAVAYRCLRTKGHEMAEGRAAEHMHPDVWDLSAEWTTEEDTRDQL